LIELLVVLAVFGLLSVILFGGFRFVSGTVTAGTARLDRAEQFRLAASFLRSQLADIRAFPDVDTGDRAAVAFMGEPEAVSFTAAPPAYLAPGGFHALRIALESGSRLVLRWRGAPGEATLDAPAIPPSVLFDGVADAAFAYFGARSPREAPDWQESWDGTGGLPRLIRLRVTYADGAPVPDIVVAVKAADGGIR
jgi:hypothetical protein